MAQFWQIRWSDFQSLRILKIYSGPVQLEKVQNNTNDIFFIGEDNTNNGQ